MGWRVEREAEVVGGIDAGRPEGFGGGYGRGAAGRLRVVVSNSPRSYREAMAEALRRLRPDFDVRLVEPGALEEELARGVPDVVLCSGASHLVQSRVPFWVDLYPGGSRLTVVGAEGRLTTRPDIGLGELLDFVDRAAGRQPGSRGRGRAGRSRCGNGISGAF
jgi:DNA-binding transcriptional LysR family regulator